MAHEPTQKFVRQFFPCTSSTRSLTFLYASASFCNRTTQCQASVYRLYCRRWNVSIRRQGMQAVRVDESDRTC